MEHHKSRGPRLVDDGAGLVVVRRLATGGSRSITSGDAAASRD
jgi:hypothetical protein